MSSGLQTPGLTPQQAIVNQDGTPTMFFFRWLLSSKAQGLVAADVEVLEAFADGAGDAALAETFAAAAEEIARGAFDGSDAAAYELRAIMREFQVSAPFLSGAGRAAIEDADGDRYALEALWAAPAPAIAAPGVTRDLLANIPATYGAGDDGRLFEATDYMHIWRWDGAALRWRFQAGDSSGQVVIGKPDGTAPNGGLWALSDGSVVAIAQDNGTVANVTTQNLTGGVFLKGDVVAAQQVATVPTWQAGAATDADTGAGQAVQSGSGVTVAAHPHTHTLSAAAAKLNPPSEANGGLPLRIGVAFWIRR